MLGAEVNLGRKLEQRLGTAIDRIPCGPRHHQENRVRLQNAGTAENLFEIARERFLLYVLRRSGLMRGEEMTTYDADPKRLRLVASDEIIDMPPGSKQINRCAERSPILLPCTVICTNR